MKTLVVRLNEAPVPNGYQDCEILRMDFTDFPRSIDPIREFKNGVTNVLIVALREDRDALQHFRDLYQQYPHTKRAANKAAGDTRPLPDFNWEVTTMVVD